MSTTTTTLLAALDYEAQQPDRVGALCADAADTIRRLTRELHDANEYGLQLQTDLKIARSKAGR